MATIVEVLDRLGRPIAQLDGATVPKRTRIMTEVIGDAQVRLPRTHWKALRQYLRPYNRIVVRTDNGAGVWPGVIVGYSWDGDEIELQCEDLRFLFDRRLLGHDFDVSGLTAGAIVEKIVRYVDEEYNVGVQIAEPMYYGGLPQPEQEPWHYADALEGLSIIVERRGGYWWVGQYGGVHYVLQRGQDLSEIALVEGRHITNVGRYMEDFKTIVNDVIATTSGEEDWVTKPIGFADDPNSIEEWGRFGELIVVSDESPTKGALDLAAEAHVERMKDPYRLLDLTLCNEDGIYQHIREGNILTVELPSYGFVGIKAEVEILGWTLNEPSEEMRIISQIARWVEV